MSPTQTSDHPSNNSGAPFDYSAHEVRVRQARSMDMKTMMDRIDCWVPGSEAILVNPELAEVLDYRDDQSVVVEQAPGTEAWLHIPVMRPRVAPEQVTTHILYFTLAAKLNKSVQIDLLNLRREGDLIYCQPVCRRQPAQPYLRRRRHAGDASEIPRRPRTRPYRATRRQRWIRLKPRPSPGYLESGSSTSQGKAIRTAMRTKSMATKGSSPRKMVESGTVLVTERRMKAFMPTGGVM